MLTVLIITVTIDLLLAVAVGMIMASFVFMQRMTDIQKANMCIITKPDDNAVNLTDAENQILQNADEQILLFHLRGHMSFSSTKSLTRRHAEAAAYKVMLIK